MAEYVGRKGTKYILGKKLGAGGEGTVYKVDNHEGCAAKIYHPGSKDSAFMRKKIETMISMPIIPIVDGILRVAWPTDILLEGSEFVGYVMPLVQAPYEIYCVYRDDASREQILPGYTWKYSVQFAYNLSWVVWYLHLNNIVIGDLNMKNVRINGKGEVVLIDCDSFDIRNPKTGEHFPCCVGLPEMLAPELQAVGNLSNAKFSMQSDDFSLAIHIFRLLMKNADPFGAKLISKKKSSKSMVDMSVPILRGECVYVRKINGKIAPSWVPPFEMLPIDVQDAFRKTFDYNELTAIRNIKNRTTAEEWNKILLKLAEKEPNPNLTRCKKNPRHIYPAHNTCCPWCSTSKTTHDFGIISYIRNKIGY